MFFSIIIPVYNAEKTLERCLNSIRAQSFDDYEVLLIDDGSEDGSFAICRALAERDARFKAMHKENRGPSAARNEGLKRVRGRYVCFIDSDDFAAPDYLESLYWKIKESSPDILFFGYHLTDREGNILETRIPPSETEGRSLPAVLSKRDLFGYTWIKCFSRGCIGESRFPEDMTLFEDEVFTCSVLEKTDRAAVLPKAVYYYVCNNESMLTGRTYNNYCELSDRVYAAWESLGRKLPEGKRFLQEKANALVRRCRFYGMERELDTDRFFESLARTRFFQMHTERTFMDRMIQRGNRPGIRMAVRLYRLKNRAARLTGILKG